MSTGKPTDTPAPGPGDGGVPPATPRRFGNYLLLKELGRGAQGVVHLAEDATLQRKIALKMLTGAGLSSKESRDRFAREARLTSKFEHPGICGVHDVGEIDGVPYIAMQYVRGTTLASLVEKSKAEPGVGKDATRSSTTITITGGGSKGGLEDVLKLIERAARALHVAHEAGLVHRDIKPANIMVTTEGQPVLLDFGLARDLEAEGQTLTQSGQIMGSPAYLAPEQIVEARGVVDRRTDVYALGVTLFECVTSRRPFEATTWDQLFHDILEGNPRNPCKLNPRIPADLRTVIEVAMDRDQTRRYQTADALAEDLRRVRAFEPIRAKAAGPITRGLKWSRRHPGRASSGAAAILFVLTGVGFFTVRTMQRVQEVRGHLVSANDALAAADYKRAAREVALAQELDPDSPAVLELLAKVERAQVEAQRKADHAKALAEADQARNEARVLGASYGETRRKIDEYASVIDKDRPGVLGRYADEAKRAAFAKRESDLRTLQRDAAGTMLSRSEALERARRLEEPWGGVSLATESALAGFYMEGWREALDQRDTPKAGAMRTAVERHDRNGEHGAELLGRGSLALTVVPSDGHVFLFRYEEYESVRAGDVIPRLVPVPTNGIGRVREGAWAEDFVPGDPCLVVRTVEAGSLAEKSGLGRGDLILRCAGRPASGWVCVREIVPGSCLEKAGVAPLARVSEVDGHPIQTRFDWEMRVSRRDSTSPDGRQQDPPARARVDGVSDSFDSSVCEIPVAEVVELIHEGASVPLSLDCLVRGERRLIELQPGARAGVRCDRTAYPLIQADANRIESSGLREMDPGSYVLYVRRPGFEDQRFNLVVPRGKPVVAHIELLPAGSIPEGFVYVPPGEYHGGGDSAAFRPTGPRTVSVPGFFIARHELTNREWYEFVNDPTTLAKIATKSPGAHLYLPEDDRVMAKQTDTGWTWDVYSAETAETPVLGLSWTDVRDYCDWRNARAEERGEAWRYGLPSEDQWEKAARGVDARLFPWGNRFDPSLAVGSARQVGYALDAPGGSEPRDESPFGLLDMAGSREEWLSDKDPNAGDKPVYLKHGSCWGFNSEPTFHCAARPSASEGRFAAAQGVRLVARRR